MCIKITHNLIQIWDPQIWYLNPSNLLFYQVIWKSSSRFLLLHRFLRLLLVAFGTLSTLNSSKDSNQYTAYICPSNLRNHTFSENIPSKSIRTYAELVQRLKKDHGKHMKIDTIHMKIESIPHELYEDWIHWMILLQQFELIQNVPTNSLTCLNWFKLSVVSFSVDLSSEKMFSKRVQNVQKCLKKKSKGFR